jgi:hypothetical protein
MLMFALAGGLFAFANRSTAKESAVIAAAPGDATGVFTPHPITPVFGTSNNTFGSDIGDIDGDGDLDAVFNNAFNEQATVWVNDGAGQFSPHPTKPSFGLQYGYSAVLGDLDTDGDLDVVLGNKHTPESIWLNDGTGVFTTHPITPTIDAGPSSEVVLGDLDADGDLDAMMATHDWSGHRVWLNDGTGGFSPHPLMPSFGPSSGRVGQLGDLDGDGDLDAVIGNAYSTPASVWLNNGTGVFTAHPTTPGFGTLTTSDLDLGDIDGDGDLDVVAANWVEPWEGAIRTEGPATVWINDGLGNLSAHPTTPTFGMGMNQDVGTADIDGDGDLDAILGNIDNQPETVWLNDGQGNFSAHPTMPSFGTSDSEEIEFGDLDGDGDQDALIAAFHFHGASVWLNRNASVNVAPSRQLVTTEAGGMATFGMALDYQPTAPVTISLSSSDPTEGEISPGQVVFSPSTWSVTQTITIIGLDDTLSDGDIAYTVTTSLAASSDPAFSGLAIADVQVVNLNDDQTRAFLPLVLSLRPWIVAINPQPIPTRPTSAVGEAYYTVTLALSEPLPTGGHFYLSSSPDQLAAVRVDDELAIFINGEEQWASILTEPRIVEVPRSLLEQGLDQPLTVVFRDAYGSVVGSSPVWLIWRP